MEFSGFRTLKSSFIQDVLYLTEISNYTWKVDKFNKKLNVPIDDFNHLMDAMRYALEKFIREKKWLY